MHSSDERLKDNISPIDDALEKISELEGVFFDWKIGDEKRQDGFISQDVEPLLPEVVNNGNDKLYQIS